MTNTIKVNMESLPDRMRSLPVDERGYPVPWFVDWIDGKPEFRAMDRRKFVRAIRDKMCWVCGEKLGIYVSFVAGPMCGINRTSSEPPCHRDCATWSAINCPFLSNPRQVRREDPEILSARENAPGMMIARNPGVAMLWHTRQYETFSDGKGGVLIQMGEPESVEWYACGRAATRDEVMYSINTGLPNLETMAKLERGGLEHLAECRKRFEKWIPA